MNIDLQIYHWILEQFKKGSLNLIPFQYNSNGHRLLIENIGSDGCVNILIRVFLGESSVSWVHNIRENKTIGNESKISFNVGNVKVVENGVPFKNPFDIYFWG